MKSLECAGALLRYQYYRMDGSERWMAHRMAAANSDQASCASDEQEAPDAVADARMF